ncbi:MAG: DUF1465 family protein [Pseudomonadota bacterium]
MSGSFSLETPEKGQSVTIPFGEKYAESEQFKTLFREGMSLVEQTASYLDGEGRTESRELSSQASLAYATESMRLTTRLMQLASWLLIRRAVNDGEMTSEQACHEKHKVKLQTTSNFSENITNEDLPETLKVLIAESFKLYKRIVALDKLIHAPKDELVDAEAPINPLATQLDQLRSAFECDFSRPQA